MAVLKLLEGLALLVPLIGTLYGPFALLDRIASPEGKAKARNAIKTGKSSVDVRPVGTMLDALFGPKHLSWRCLATSCAMSVVFSVLALGAYSAYITSLSDYFDRRGQALQNLDEATKKAYPVLRQFGDAVVAALEQSQLPDREQKLAEMKRAQEELERLRKLPPDTRTAPAILAWMLAMALVSINLISDYVALGKTRLILKRLGHTNSKLAVGSFLVLDVLLALLIWLVVFVCFALINYELYRSWFEHERALLTVTQVVSLLTTLATSIWIYTYLIGKALTSYWYRTLQFLLTRVTGLIDPYEHPFKVIGIVGSLVMALFLIIVLLIFA
jgi:hypothetical protein